MAERADVIVMGLGPGGEDAAARLAEAGLDVVGVEAELVGGECPYWGCVPSKMVIRAADLLAEGRRIDGMAGHSTVEPSWQPVARRIREDATDDWDDTAAARRLESKGARLVRGWGHTLFRWESLLNTPLFVGFPGFVSKLWLANDRRGVYCGVYEWDGPERAEHYARSLWRVLALVCEPRSIHYRVVPGLRRDALLIDPHRLDATAPEERVAWWRLVAA